MAAPVIKLYRSDTQAEVGTEGNPIDFGVCNAGETKDLPYDILLYNDKDGSNDSADATNLALEVRRVTVTNQFTSDGSASQSFTASVTPVAQFPEEEVLVDGEQWRRVDNFTGVDSFEKVYTFDYSTGTLTFGDGIHGAIPPANADIQLSFDPDLNTYGKAPYEELWISSRSIGVITHELTVDVEQATKVNNTTVQVEHYPEITEVVGVWDNASKTGTNYYTGGSFDSDTGLIALGTAMTASTPYVEYKYQAKSDNESGYTSLGRGARHQLAYRLPKQNAKNIKFRITVPPDASTEGGNAIKVVLRVYYNY